MEVNIRPRLSHSNSFGNDAEKDTAGCRAFNRKYIVIGGANILLNTGFGVLPLCPGDADHFLHKISILKTMADIIADAILASNNKPQSV